MNIVHVPVLKACYFLHNAKIYSRIKKTVYAILADPESRWRKPVDGGLSLLVIASVFFLIREVKQPLNGHFPQHFETFTVTVFIVEYLLRFWLHSSVHNTIIKQYEKAAQLNTPFRLRRAIQEVLKEKWRYITSPLSIIDLLAILPTYRPIRLLRIFMLFRLFKLFRYTRGINQFANILAEKRFELYILGIFFTFIVVSAATAIYLFEAQQPSSDIQSYFDAIYWALITLTTVGYGDIVPHSPEGRVVTIALIVSGIGVIAFATSIFVSAFSEKMQRLQHERIFQGISRLSDYTLICGYGRMGHTILEELSTSRQGVVIIDTDNTGIEKARQRGYLAITGDASNSHLLEQLNLAQKAKTVLCITENDINNVYITLTARSLSQDVHIISRANETASIKKLYLAGADHVVTPNQDMALVAAEYVGQPVAFEAIYSILSGQDELVIDAIKLFENSAFDGIELNAIDFKHHQLILFGVIQTETDSADEQYYFELTRSHFIFNPHDRFTLRGNDVMIVFGHQDNIAHFRKQARRLK